MTTGSANALLIALKLCDPIESPRLVGLCWWSWGARGWAAVLVRLPVPRTLIPSAAAKFSFKPPRGGTGSHTLLGESGNRTLLVFQSQRSPFEAGASTAFLQRRMQMLSQNGEHSV
jgi:hypothetical protein